MSDKILTWEEAVVWLKNQPEKQDLVQACYYDDPPEKSAERFYCSTEWQAVRKLLAGVPRGRVLDLGAGRGISSYAFARDGWQVTALEPDTGAVVGTGAIRRLLSPELAITIVEERGEQLPFADSAFDLVYGRAVFHHADDLAAFSKEAGRVLKPGGTLLLTREHVVSSLRDVPRFLESHPLHQLYRGENAYLLSAYLQALAAGGVGEVKVLPPHSSDINFFPSSQQQLFSRLRRARSFPLPNWFIRLVLVPRMNREDQTPGRLYSFMGKKSMKRVTV